MIIQALEAEVVNEKPEREEHLNEINMKKKEM